MTESLMNGCHTHNIGWCWPRSVFKFRAQILSSWQWGRPTCSVLNSMYVRLLSFISYARDLNGGKNTARVHQSIGGSSPLIVPRTRGLSSKFENWAWQTRSITSS